MILLRIKKIWLNQRFFNCLIENASNNRQLKDDIKYIAFNDVDKLQDNLLKIVENESKDDNYFGNILSLTNNQNKK